MNNTQTQKRFSNNFFSTSWNGDLSLVSTYWVIFYIPSFILSGAALISEIFTLFFLIYSIWASKSVWAAANKYTGFRGWAAAAKFSVTVNAIFISLILFYVVTA